MRLICGKHKQEHRSETKLQTTEIQVEATTGLRTEQRDRMGGGRP